VLTTGDSVNIVGGANIDESTDSEAASSLGTEVLLRQRHRDVSVLAAPNLLALE